MRSLERYARNIRNENRTTVTLGKGEPSPNEGVEGDIRINTTTAGLKLYAKYQGQWYSAGLAKVLNKPTRISQLQMQSTDTFITDNSTGTASNTIPDFEGSLALAETENAIASLASKINVMAVAINKILERLQ